MIISASRRTDIPSFYAKWFANRLRDGFVVVENPYFPEQKTKLRLSTDVVDAMVLWTKDPYPLMKYLDVLDDSAIPYYFQFTLTPYGKDIEPHLRDKNDILRTFQELASRLGKECVIWRYDPILFSPEHDIEYHEQAFKRFCEQLAGYTQRCVISFLDEGYKKTRSENALKLNMRSGTLEEQQEIATRFASVAKKHDIELETCAEGIDLAALGIRHGHCIDGELLEEITGKKLLPKVNKKDSGQRKLCGCLNSTDIGIYNTCRHGCEYCYANFDETKIKEIAKQHDDGSPLLVGKMSKDEIESIPFSKNQKLIFKENLFDDDLFGDTV